MPNGAAQPSLTPTPTPQPTYYDEEEPVEGEITDDPSGTLAGATLSVLNIALALL